MFEADAKTKDLWWSSTVAVLAMLSLTNQSVLFIFFVLDAQFKVLGHYENHIFPVTYLAILSLTLILALISSAANLSLCLSLCYRRSTYEFVFDNNGYWGYVWITIQSLYYASQIVITLILSWLTQISLSEKFDDLNSHPDWKFINYVQEEFFCCGKSSYMDWNSTYAESKKIPFSCTFNEKEMHVFSSGCRDIILSYMFVPVIFSFCLNLLFFLTVFILTCFHDLHSPTKKSSFIESMPTEMQLNFNDRHFYDNFNSSCISTSKIATRSAESSVNACLSTISEACELSAVEDPFSQPLDSLLCSCESDLDNDMVCETSHVPIIKDVTYHFGICQVDYFSSDNPADESETAVSNTSHVFSCEFCEAQKSCSPQGEHESFPEYSYN